MQQVAERADLALGFLDRLLELAERALDLRIVGRNAPITPNTPYSARSPSTASKAPTTTAMTRVISRGRHRSSNIVERSRARLKN